MAYISVSDVQPGMVLAGDIVATGERLLLCAGSELTEADLRTLRTWGVFHVDVRGITREDLVSRAAGDLDPETRAVIEARLDALFARANRTHPLIDELVHLARIRFYRRARGASDGNGA